MAKKKESAKGSKSKEEVDVEEQEIEKEDDVAEEEPSFSDPEDFEDIDDSELLADILRNAPQEHQGYEGVIAVDGIPKVGEAKIQKLKNAIGGIFHKFGKVVSEHYPTDDEGVTRGYCFFEYDKHENAVEAVRATNNHRLDKMHTFIVNHYSDFSKYSKVPEHWETPEPQEYKDVGNLQAYLQDPDCYDQYSVIYEGGEKTAIYLNSSPEPTLLQERIKWTESYVRWSPLGTYLATFHQRGIALWGGADFVQIAKFSHFGVTFIDFSPCEKYVVTFSPASEHKGFSQGGESEPTSVIIWDIRTGSKKRSFHPPRLPLWPLFRWSHDDKYFARFSQDMISVFETPSFGMLDKKSIKIPGVKDFSWSPSDNIIAYWVAEDKDIPARVTLLEIPSRNELRVKNLFNVAECKMHWQKSGDFLCVKVDRYSKVKKEKNDIKYSGLYYNFEVFHLREKQIPVDSVEIKETIQSFAWEPIGHKFAVVHGDSPSISVSFYEVKKGQTPTLAKKMDRKTCNEIVWSPNGQYVILAGLGAMGGILEFVDTSDYVIMNYNQNTDHFQCSHIEWDPTGRYVVTAVSWWQHKVDNTYWLWSFQGKVLQRHSKDRFCQLLWRPRPPTLLTPQKITEIRKNLKKYSVQFDLEDKKRSSRESKELIEKRRKLMAEYKKFRSQKVKEFQSQKKRRLELRQNTDTDELLSNKDNLEEEVVEFLIKEEEVAVE